MNTIRIIKISTTLMIMVMIITGFKNAKMSLIENTFMQQDTTLHITLPAEGKLVKGVPIGDGWTNLLISASLWNLDNQYWKLAKGELRGYYMGGQRHDYAWTKKTYKDFELNALVKMDGSDPNSGVCIRIHPVNSDDVPGYQIDMGEGYWGCLWEEKRAGMVQQFPVSLAHKIVKNKDWNHYYIKAKGHHIEAWLNGVKTIDKVHPEGFVDGAIGFQLCHGEHRTILDVKALYIRELK